MTRVRTASGPTVGFAALAILLTLGVPSASPQTVLEPASTPGAAIQVAPPDTEIEQFLTRARVVSKRDAGKGVTGSIRATLSDGTMTHDAHIQVVDEYRREFRSRAGMELDFRDSWMFNVAAYKLDRLLGLGLVPVSVAGNLGRQPAAITWWIDDVVMDEGKRLKEGISAPPDRAAYWSEQLHMMRLFDELLYNTDRNMGNMLIGSDWRIWGIDHTRAFRKHTRLRNPALVVRCDRAVFQRLKALDQQTLARETRGFLDGGQVRAILARRDLIVAKIESIGGAALFDRQSHTQPAALLTSAP